MTLVSVATTGDHMLAILRHLQGVVDECVERRLALILQCGASVDVVRFSLRWQRVLGARCGEADLRSQFAEGKRSQDGEAIGDVRAHLQETQSDS